MSENHENFNKIEQLSIDKRLENLYNTHAFTNEELDDIRREMAAYAVDASHDTTIAKEALFVITEYH